MARPKQDQREKSRNESRVRAARSKTQVVEAELKLAAARLHLASTALEHTLPASEKKGDVKKALVENAVVEQKVKESAKELAQVTELLEGEEAEGRRPS